MNIQLGAKGIDWTDATWNPLTGCYHGCEYCYARRMAERFGSKNHPPCDDVVAIWRGKPLYVSRSFSPPFPWKFAPTFYPQRLDEPRRRKKPTKIFVVSSGDLFGDWVPDNWIEEVIKVVHDCPQHTFQFLTQNPVRLIGYDWPDNCWVGATATNGASMPDVLSALALVDAEVRFISLEPLLGEVDTLWPHLEWLIIGPQSGPGGGQPERIWVQKLIEEARWHGIPVWLKGNLEWEKQIQEWPLVAGVKEAMGTHRHPRVPIVVRGAGGRRTVAVPHLESKSRCRQAPRRSGQCFGPAFDPSG